MAKASLAALGDKLKRLFLGRIKVHDLAEGRRTEPPALLTHFRTVETHPIRSVPRVGAALFTQWKRSKAETAGAILRPDFAASFRAKSVPVSRFKAASLSSYKLKLTHRCSAKNGMWRIKHAPQLRRNRVNFIKDPPKFANSKLLALYSPIYQENVSKSSLDKSTGRLHLWYVAHSVRAGTRFHLLLFRVFGGGEPLRWVWLPADKKIR